MIGDTRQEAMIGAVGDLVDAEHLKFVQAALVEVLGDDPGDDLADRRPADPQQPGDLRLVHLLGKPGREIFKVAGVRSVRPRPRHRLKAQAPTARAAHAPQLALNDAATTANIEMAPAFDAPVVYLQPAPRAAARADRPPATQHDGYDRPLAAKLHIAYPGPEQPQHPVICRLDAHVVLLRKPLTIDSQQPAFEDGGASPSTAQPATTLRALPTPLHAGTSRRSGRHVTPKRRGEPVM
jgi:hypothetical protein